MSEKNKFTFSSATLMKKRKSLLVLGNYTS